MIQQQEIGPRIFYTADAAWEWRAEMGGRVFLPDPVNGEVYWFPASMTPTMIVTHRLTKGLSGYLGDGTDRPKPVGLNPVYIVDGHTAADPDSDLAADGTHPPFRIFNSQRQDYLAGTYATRENAEANAERLNNRAGAW